MSSFVLFLFLSFFVLSNFPPFFLYIPTCVSVPQSGSVPCTKAQALSSFVLFYFSLLLYWVTNVFIFFHMVYLYILTCFSVPQGSRALCTKAQVANVRMEGDVDSSLTRLTHRSTRVGHYCPFFPFSATLSSPFPPFSSPSVCCPHPSLAPQIQKIPFIHDVWGGGVAGGL